MPLGLQEIAVPGSRTTNSFTRHTAGATVLGSHLPWTICEVAHRKWHLGSGSGATVLWAGACHTSTYYCNSVGRVYWCLGWDSSLPPHKEYDHTIPLLPNSSPINTRPYRYPPLHKDEIEKQVRTTNTSPFASPVLLVQKKDGTWRFYVDYMKLNAITVMNKFPMPLVDEILDEL
jgi:hypothetical protein